MIATGIPSPMWFEKGICPLCWLREIAAIKATRPGNKGLKAMQALLSRRIAAYLSMPDSIPPRERSTEKLGRCRRARTAGSECPQPA